MKERLEDITDIIIVDLVTDVSDVWYKGCKWEDVEDKPELYNKEEIDTLLSGKQDKGDYITKDEVKTDYYNKVEVDNKIQDIHIPTKTSELTNDSEFVTQSTTYTKEEVDEKISHIDLTDYYNKEEVDTKIGKIEVPTKVSQLTNDKRYISKIYNPDDDVSDIILNENEDDDVKIGRSENNKTVSDSYVGFGYDNETSIFGNGAKISVNGNINLIPSNGKKVYIGVNQEVATKSDFNDLRDITDEQSSAILSHTQQINDLEESSATKESVQVLSDKVNELELYKQPNIVIYGNPTINSGQIRNFSSTNYGQIPFVIDFNKKPFAIKFSFQTGNDVINQQNIFDSKFGLAFAIRNSHFVVAYGTDGTKWDNEIVGTHTIQQHTTYYVIIDYFMDELSIGISTESFDNVTYDGGEMLIDFTPYPTQIIIGKDLTNSYIFGGIINLNYCSLLVDDVVKWEGMEVGTSKLNKDLSNISEEGKEKVNEIVDKTHFVITEDDFTLEYDATKGVAPYNASYGYTNVTITNPNIKWVEGAMYTFILDTKVATSANRNVRVRLGESDSWHPVMVTSGIAAGSTVFVKAINNIFIYKTNYIAGGALHCFYDTNTTYTINFSLDGGKYKAGGTDAQAISRYSLIAMKPDGTWEKLTDTTKAYSTAITKTVNPNGFVLGQIRYYNYTTVMKGGDLIAGTAYVYNKAPSVNASYSFNCGTAPNWAIGDWIYLVGTMQDGLFYLDETKWWDNKLPTEKDGKVYIRLGVALTTTDSTMTLLEDRPVFYHDGTSIKQYGTNTIEMTAILSDGTTKSYTIFGKEN